MYVYVYKYTYIYIYIYVHIIQTHLHTALGYCPQRKLTRVFTWGSNSHGQLGLSGVPVDAQVKESYIYTKEPQISAKEPYKSSNEDSSTT